MTSKPFSNQTYLDRYQRFYTFSKDEQNEEVRVFNGYNDELSLKEVKELIEGLNNTYINIDKEVLLERTLATLKEKIDQNFNTYSFGLPLYKEFKKDLKRHYKLECPNCLGKFSSKESNGFWVAQNCHIKIHGKKFCSADCIDIYINKVYITTFEEKKSKYIQI